jgi:deoxyribonuclease V
VIVCVDVDYRETAVVTACVGFEAWTDEAAAHELVVRSSEPAVAYAPGRFFERELPYLRAALEQFVHAPSVARTIDVVVIDGYVWLAPGHRGLGAHLHAAIDRPVVGVAKTSYLSAEAIEVVRGASARPLYVTAEGIDPRLAAEHVKAMHGPFRIPTHLKRADSLARGFT